MEAMYYNYDFGKLPVEVIEHIFTYLTIDDILDASLVCQQWFRASLSPEISESIKFVIENKFSVDDVSYSILLNGSMRRVTSLKFISVEFDEANTEDEDVWKMLGSTITDLNFKWCKLTEKKLFNILVHFPSLSVLSLSFDVNEELDSNKIFLKYVDKLTSLKLKGTFPLTEKTYHKICNKDPTIERLTLEITEYPDIYSMASTIKILERLSANLKYLSLYFFREGINLISCLPQIQDLHLESLVCFINDSIETSAFTQFAKKLYTLIDLDICSVDLDDLNFTDICTYMPNLRRLRINECIGIENKGIIQVAKLKKLETLIITECEYISNKGIIRGIAKNRNPTLKYICLSGGFSDKSLIAIAKNLPNLRKMQINTSFSLGEKCIRTVFEHLKLLRSLELRSTDIDVNEQYVLIQGLVTSDPKDFTISSMKGLRELSLIGFHKIPGAALEDIATLMELQSLKISNFREMSNIEKICENCKCLNTIEFSNCDSISYEKIHFLVTNLKKLKFLTIKQSYKLNDKLLESIKSIAQTIKKLKITNFFAKV